ncbi:dihydrolipoyl dehydrogenase [Halalkalibacter sp. APA_J-10(15)]|uniref:dihydrolipoyl dehydrogenase n=1 Tax=Halalkalibacter sp. APA_J-10(15) TaxID=2933805 RepID=UPI001FF4DAA9|nr:dihydrolipoyl dehydrogenase [Halalkalibacter sp. APA_J-10(15)]MCK0472530.1 dihydrolipoyl dehydrogenase [Halalkalibacter sp. APA_J-10(15)]
MAEEFDVVILGGGTGGYVAAIRAVQNGLSVAIVEKEKLGGTCLHKGCIPTKALLRSAEVLQTAKKAEVFGVQTGEVSFDFEQVQKRKDDIVAQLYKGVRHLMKKGKITVYEGIGRLLGPSIFSPLPGTISVERNDGSDNTMLIGQNVLIATGSSPRTLPGLDVDGTSVLTSDEMLTLQKLPSSIVIIGGGVIGIEWASMLADFGVDVTVVEASERILPSEDADVSKEAARLLEKKGIQFIVGAEVDVTEIKRLTEGARVPIKHEGENRLIEAEKLLLSVGRSANVQGIGLENTDIEVIDGVISVNDVYQTKNPHIYAIGDVIGGLQLAHVASHEGIIAVDHIARKKVEPLPYDQVPTCIYSSPEMARVGLTEEEARQRGEDVRTAIFPFKAIGKALVLGEDEGFVKLVVNADQDVLGVHMIGPHVTDMISESALAKVLDASHIELAETIRPHPSLSEIVGEVALAVDGKAIHL